LLRRGERSDILRGKTCAVSEASRRSVDLCYTSKSLAEAAQALLFRFRQFLDGDVLVIYLGLGAAMDLEADDAGALILSCSV
jgi:hypothetical protein